MKILTVLFLVLFVSGCADNPTMPYRQSAVVILVKADDFINVFNNESHTVVLQIHQLKEVASFVNLSETKEGIAKLMTKSKPDESFITNKRFVIRPGETKKLVLDRFKGATVLGIVAGFYEYDNIEKISWHTTIPEYSTSYFDLQLSMKVSKDSINVKRYGDLYRVF